MFNGDMVTSPPDENGPATNGTAENGHADPETGTQTSSDDDEEEIPQMSLWMSLVLLAAITVVSNAALARGCCWWLMVVQLVAVTAEWLVDSIDGLTSDGGISKEFVGVILLPIVGNAAGQCLCLLKVTSRANRS